MNMPDISVYKGFFGQSLCKFYYNTMLNEIPWTDTLKKEGGELRRLYCSLAYLSSDKVPFSYKELNLNGSLWTQKALDIRNSIESKVSNTVFNSVLCSLYKNGNDGMGWNSDYDKCLVSSSKIATLCLGSSRKISFKNKENGATFYKFLNSGDLLVMWGQSNNKYLTSVLRDKNVLDTTIFLTYRYYV